MTDRKITDSMLGAGGSVLRRAIDGGLFGKNAHRLHPYDVRVKKMMTEIYNAMSDAADADGEQANCNATEEKA